MQGTAVPNPWSSPASTPGWDAPRLFLASQSPRRREMLTLAGVNFEATLPGFEDDHLRVGRASPARWVASLACLKARAALWTLRSRGHKGPVVVLGADTVVAKGARLIGKARNAEEAGEIIRTLRDGEHRVITGFAMVTDTPGAPRTIGADVAAVRVGSISEQEVDEYVRSALWKGKAGAYNLAERTSAGWPITCEGDPATVMGLPMIRLTPLLAGFVARPPSPGGAGAGGGA